VRIRSVIELQAAIGAHDPGDKVTLKVLRRGKVLDVTLNLSARPDAAVDVWAMEEFRRTREAEAQAYWERVFAPLINTGA